MDNFATRKLIPVEIALNEFGLSTLVLIVWLAGFIVQLIFYWGLFSKLAFYQPRTSTPAILHEAVSVVLSARNEIQNLEKFLPLLLSQDYPDFEVVVVNDCSDDETEEYLTELARTNIRLKPVHLRQSLNFFKGKKFPLSMGIKSAKNDLLVLTDADCRPENNQWIRSIVDAYEPQTEVLLAYGPYEKTSGLLNKLIRWDTLHIALQYLSFALAGIPYMGVGRNLSYRKSLFVRNKGFTAHYNIASGDDDLFVSQVARKNNTSVLVSAENRMLSVPKKRFSEWVSQKQRHYSTGFYYRKSIKLLLGSYSASLITFYIGFVLLFFLPEPIEVYHTFYIYPLFLVLLFLLRYVSQLIIFSKAAKKLGEKGLLGILPFADVFFVIFTPLLAMSNLFVKAPKWK